MPRIFLDMDGVLADFDTRAEVVLGTTPRRFDAQYPDQKEAQEEFWKRINAVPDFFRTLPLMPDARKLYDAVEHLNPTILTGVGKNADKSTRAQKLAWGEEHFPGVPMICCRAADKRLHMGEPGSILIDDWDRHMGAWQEHGGIFILHTSAAESIKALKKLGVI